MVKKEEYSLHHQKSVREDLTTVWHRRARQDHQGIQALHQGRIWEHASAAPNGSCLENAFENK